MVLLPDRRAQPCLPCCDRTGSRESWSLCSFLADLLQQRQRPARMRYALSRPESSRGQVDRARRLLVHVLSGEKRYAYNDIRVRPDHEQCTQCRSTHLRVAKHAYSSLAPENRRPSLRDISLQGAPRSFSTGSNKSTSRVRRGRRHLAPVFADYDRSSQVSSTLCGKSEGA